MAPPSQVGWVINSGATSHMSLDHGTVPPLLPLLYLVYVTVGNGARVTVRFYSNIHLCLPSSNFILKSVLMFPLSFKTSYLLVNSLVIMSSLLNFTRLVSLLRTSRPGMRSFAAIAPATSTPFHLNRLPHWSKLSSPLLLLHLFGMLAMVILAPLPSTTFKGLASLRVIRVITTCATLASLGSMWGSHLVHPLHHPSVHLN
jgi:hypothetical protein